MKKCLLFAVALVLISSFALGQNTLEGNVYDADSQNPLEFATIAVLNAADSTVVTGGISNDKGQYSLTVPNGSYILSVSFISYSDFRSEPITVDKSSKMVDVFLSLDSNQIQDVEITAEGPTMELSLDKKIYHVGKDINNAGTSASEVLDNIPSVQVDLEGNVSLRGSGNVRILVDGKPSGMTGLGSTNALRNLPAHLIESVEVITNPSARYDAEGMTGIINLVLKKERKSGFNASLDFGTGIPDNHSAAVNLNYRAQKVNLFSNLGGRYRGGPGSGFNFFEYFNDNPFPISTQDRSFDRGGWSGNGKLGLEYFITDKTTITGAFNLSHGEQDNNALLEYFDEDPISQIQQASFREDDEFEDEDNLGYSLNFTKNFEQKGRKINLDVRYEESGENESSDLFEDLITGSSSSLPLTQRSSNDENQDEWLFQADYIYPFSKTHKFEIGGKSTLRGIKNNFLGEQLNGGVWDVLPGVTNDFEYDEDIVAAYAIYANTAGKFSYQAGARLEYTDILTLLKTTNERNQRNYTNLFPSAFLTYQFTDQDALQLSYSKRMRRPRFRELNPFFSFSDSRRFFGGNPNLNPEFSDAVELSFLNDWEFATLSSAIYYRHTDDVISRLTRSISDTVVQFLPVNLATRDAIGAEFIANKQFSKAFSLDGSFNAFHFKTDGGEANDELSAEGFSYFARMNSRFTIAKDYKGQFRFNYRGPSDSGQGTRRGLLSADAGVAKDIFNRKGTLSFNARDLFNSRKYRYENLTDDFFNEGEFQWRSRSLTLGLNLRINQEKQQRRGGERPQGGGEDFGGGEF